MRLATHGLGDAVRRATSVRTIPKAWDPARVRHRAGATNGTVVLSASTRALRDWAIDLVLVGLPRWNWSDGSTYVELDYPANTGEVQLFENFTERVARAQAIRDELFPGRGHAELLIPERELVWAEVGRRAGATGAD